jgi:putative tryptophan/tyrosine transport system substrate-binding protein
MRRREFITLVGGAAAAGPLAARAQQRSAMPVIGYITSRAPGEEPNLFAAFHQGLKEAGFIDGQNVTIDYRWPDGKSDAYPALVADLARRRVAVIAAVGDFAAVAARATPTTVSVVFLSGVDPVEYGLVASLNRPGGNMTGITTLNAELIPKRLELLRELIPAATSVAFLIAPGPTGNSLSRDSQAAARINGVEAHILYASNENELDAAFLALAQFRVGGLVVGTGGLFNRRSQQLATLALRNAVPTIYQYREFAAAGGLMSYGGSLIEANRLVGTYAARMLMGEKPGDLPVQQATKVELIVNLKTAKALGLTVPLTLLGRADEVIE